MHEAQLCMTHDPWPWCWFVYRSASRKFARMTAGPAGIRPMSTRKRFCGFFEFVRPWGLKILYSKSIGSQNLQTKTQRSKWFAQWCYHKISQDNHTFVALLFEIPLIWNLQPKLLEEDLAHACVVDHRGQPGWCWTFPGLQKSVGSEGASRQGWIFVPF